MLRFYIHFGKLTKMKPFFIESLTLNNNVSLLALRGDRS